MDMMKLTKETIEVRFNELCDHYSNWIKVEG